jgi:hypothetical protein
VRLCLVGPTVEVFSASRDEPEVRRQSCLRLGFQLSQGGTFATIPSQGISEIRRQDFAVEENSLVPGQQTKQLSRALRRTPEELLALLDLVQKVQQSSELGEAPYRGKQLLAAPDFGFGKRGAGQGVDLAHQVRQAEACPIFLVHFLDVLDRTGRDKVEKIPDQVDVLPGMPKHEAEPLDRLVAWLRLAERLGWELDPAKTGLIDGIVPIGELQLNGGTADLIGDGQQPLGDKAAAGVWIGGTLSIGASNSLLASE